MVTSSQSSLNNQQTVSKSVKNIKSKEKRLFQRHHARSVSNVNDKTVRNAIAQQQLGVFRDITQLAKKMMTDGIYSAAINKRVNNLIRCDFDLLPADSNLDSAVAVSEVALKKWWDYVPEKKLSALMTSYLNVGAALAFITWEEAEPDVYVPKEIDVLDTEYLRFDQTKQIWEYETQDQGRVEIVPGDGNWLLLINSWQPGHNAGFAASLGLSYVSKAFALKDWADGNAAHIDNIAVIQQVDDPMNDEQDDIDALVDEIQVNKLEKVLYVSKDKKVTFENSISQYNPSAFSNLIDEVNKTYQIAILGGNLSSDAGAGGSYAAANIHHIGELNFARADNAFLTTELRNQFLKLWIVANFGEEALDIVPYPQWNLSEESDSNLQTSIGVLTSALQIAESSGYRVDNIPELLEKYGIIVRLPEDDNSNNPQQ